MTRKSIKAIGQDIEAAREQLRHHGHSPSIAANDTLFKDLSDRWGPGFAQWLMDDLARQAANS